MCIVYRAQLSFLRQIYYVKVFFDILEFRFHTKLGKAKNGVKCIKKYFGYQFVTTRCE